MPYTDISSAKHFDQVVAEAGDKLVVVDFHATWCGPCHAIAPAYKQLSDKLLHATFLKVDTDKIAAVAQKFSIRAMPTFIFLKNGQKVDELKGADKAGLEEKATRHAGAAPIVHKSASKVSTDGLTSLRPLVDNRNIQCLNEAPEHTLKYALDGSGFLESDADEQLLVTLPFHQPTRLRALVLVASKAEQAPRRLKLFVNSPSLGFDQAMADAPVQEFELTAAQWAEGAVRLDLRLVKFQRVSELSLFVVSNIGDEETTILEGIDVFGEPMEAGSKGPLEKIDDGHGH